MKQASTAGKDQAWYWVKIDNTMLDAEQRLSYSRKLTKMAVPSGGLMALTHPSIRLEVGLFVPNKSVYVERYLIPLDMGDVPPNPCSQHTIQNPLGKSASLSQMLLSIVLTEKPNDISGI